MLNYSEKKSVIFIENTNVKRTYIFKLAIEILLWSVQKQMRNWILKGTSLKTPFHIALFRMIWGYHYSISNACGIAGPQAITSQSVT